MKTKMKDEPVADLKGYLEALFLKDSRFHTKNEVTQPSLTALFVNRLFPEING